MSHRISRIIVVLCLAAIFLAACGGGSATPAAPAAPTTASQPAAPTKAPQPTPTTPPPTAIPTVEPTAEPTLPAVLSGTKIDMNNPIFKAFYAIYNKFPRRTRAEVFSPKSGRAVSMVIETDAKDHLRLETSGMGGTGEVTMTMVIISPTMYLKQGATWQKLPGMQMSMFLGMLSDADSLQQMLNAFDELASYTVTPLGPEDVNGVPAMAYASEFTLKDGKSSKGKAWVGPDGLIIKDITQTSDGAVITTTYDFDPSIKVEAPLP